ncbi:unnamed protein product [Malus baccata var. baccata]
MYKVNTFFLVKAVVISLLNYLIIYSLISFSFVYKSFSLFVFFFSFFSLVSPQIFFRFFDASAIVQVIQEIPNSTNEKLVSLDLIFGFPASDGVAKDFMGNCEVGLVSDGEFVTTKTAKTMDDKKKGEGETTTIEYFIWKTLSLTSPISIGVLEIRSESITWLSTEQQMLRCKCYFIHNFVLAGFQEQDRSRS